MILNVKQRVNTTECILFLLLMFRELIHFVETDLHEEILLEIGFIVETITT